jgi:Zn-dependent protease with chaperone function
LTLPSEAAAAGHAAGELIAARFFDGRSSQPVPCMLWLIPGASKGAVALQIHLLAPAGPAPSAPWREFTASQIEWPDAGETRIAVIRFADGSQAQTLEPQRLTAALRAAGYRAPGLHALAEKMASHRGALLAGVVACAAISAGVWLYGVPALSKVITHFMPTKWETQLGETTLEALDKAWLKPSKLGADRQAQITADFDALVKKAAPDGSAPRYRLLFRSMGLMLGQREKSEKSEKPVEGKTGNTGDTEGGGNAFALPGGVLVMTDELVAVAEPGAVLGVLAHELGHVENRHATRVAVESSLLGTAIALISGDPTSVIATVPVALASLSFSRSHELEADCYALRMLARGGQSTEPLARLLETISRGHGGSNGQSGAMAGVLSSHPSTPARVQLLRDPAAVRQGCGG